ncbi:MAG: DDE-type integrase/transposase/recombinase [Bacteroidota bacterium]
MKPLYEIAGVSKQAHQQYMVRQASQVDRTSYYLGLIEEARQLHPVIGLAKIWYLYRPEGIGRESFERLGQAAGYAIERKPVTTFKGSSRRYPNLLKGESFNAANQVWVTDITYYRVGDTYYYISMIMDLYLRKIVACQLSDSLHAHHSIKLLRRAIQAADLPSDHQLIHHSDKGSQYTSLAYTKLLSKKQIGISMCRSVYENTHMERLNGIIKNAYLIHWAPTSFSALNKQLKRAVTNYHNCPHGKLGMQTPNAFEQSLKNVPLNQRTPLKVFTFNQPKNDVDPSQLSLFNS